MLSVAIKIDSAKLSNPDADIRYQLPVFLHQATDGKVKDDGYDYLKDGTLVIFMIGDDEACVPDILKSLVSEPFLGNDLKDAISVGVDVGPGYNSVYPESDTGRFIVED